MRRAGRLRGIDNHERTSRMSHSRHTCNINGVAGHIGSVRHHHGTRARRDQLLELVVVEHAARIATRMLNRHTLLRRQAIKRT